MGLFDRTEKNRDIVDAVGSDPKALEERAGASGRILITALNKAVHMQTGLIEGYVDWLRSKHPDASPYEIQALMDKHIMRFATGSGAGVGAAAAVPGIGFATGAAAVGAESMLFLDAAALYVMASAHLRGVDIRNEERRRALILVVLLGSAGTMIVDTVVGNLGDRKGASVAATLTRFGTPSLNEVNSRLMKSAMKRFSKKVWGTWIGKVMPLGIGAVVGTVANRKIVTKLIENSRTSLGAVPQAFATPAREDVAKPDTVLSDVEV
ncbi:hypothetical protein C1Y63_01740 [Corynebacterium sp. 13CS0277]|uniref:hypothetical protein n=1 Tax=Corynebacterium sp. 13CS0277 TaxID=2071994 RepID=UPI000D0295F2|nr:hypothetical protein [Corynebacterium sp. 13CS0277]PRQ12302.1 hypothetical protein C1Y63_01740 [Corynebacterium sp. 13CS0277]